MSSPQPQFHVQAEDLLARIAQLEAELEAMQHTLDASNQLDSLGLLTGAIAHEFNNILTPVLSYAKVAMDHPDDAALTRTALERVTIGIEKATRIAGSVLRLAGSSQQQQGGEPCCRVREALTGALAVLPEPMDRHGVTLRVEVADDVCVRMYQTDLEHVLLNLILNAMRAMEPDGGVLTIEQVGGDERCSTWNIGDAAEDGAWRDGRFVGIVVSDTGSGMPRQVVDRLGIPVYDDADQHSPITHSSCSKDGEDGADGYSGSSRSVASGGQRAGQSGCGGGDHNTSHSERSGSGLGLVITQRLLEAAGASMRVKTQAGVGTAFLLSIPRSTRLSQAG